ncbi:MAG: transposase, partial [Waterburya sp.]
RTLNREIAKHNRGYWSNKLALMTEKRNRRVRDYINKIARYIANYCIDSGIGTVVFGWRQILVTACISNAAELKL